MLAGKCLGDVRTASIPQCHARCCAAALGARKREYEQTIELIRGGVCVVKSNFSCEFGRASAAQMKALTERGFDGQGFPVVMIDGMERAGETMVVALHITDDGRGKRILGVRRGATENAAVCAELLADLQGRGLVTAQPTMFVLDAFKAPHAATRRIRSQNVTI